MKKYNGYIKWFDNMSGEGMVSIPILKKSFYVHWSSDLRLKILKDSTLQERQSLGLFIKYEHLDLVEVSIYQDYSWSQIKNIIPKKWTSKEVLLGDLLIDTLNKKEDSNWFDHCLNNILRDCEKIYAHK